MNEPLPETIRLEIAGKVQGVFYRKSARERAIELGISGTVKNTDNGNVEIIATGLPAQLLEFIAWCNQGPPRAVVTNITSTSLPLQTFKNFTVEHS